MISFKLLEALESPSASTPSMEKVNFKDSTDKMRDVTAKPPSPQISGCEMVSSAEDTKVEDSQSPSRRKVTINKDTKTPRISITRKIDRSTTPRSEVESSSPIRGEKEKNSNKIIKEKEAGSGFPVRGEKEKKSSKDANEKENQEDKKKSTSSRS